MRVNSSRMEIQTTNRTREQDSLIRGKRLEIALTYLPLQNSSSQNFSSRRGEMYTEKRNENYIKYYYYFCNLCYYYLCSTALILYKRALDLKYYNVC